MKQKHEPKHVHKHERKHKRKQEPERKQAREQERGFEQEHEQEQDINRPTSNQLGKEIQRRELSKEVRKTVLNAIKTLVVISAVAVLMATLLFPTVRVERGSMTPTLRDGEQLIIITVGRIKRGDIIAFSAGNQTLIKRVIATAGESVEIDPNGAVYIDGVILNEPYLSTASLGQCDIEFPYIVPENHFFVMGDNRDASIDSRLSEIGAIQRDAITGKTILRIWPLNRVGIV